MLPSWLEPKREELEEALPTVEVRVLEGRSIMKHIFNKGKDSTKPTLLLLHGTGGNELDLLPIAGRIDDEASVLSVRGNVLENGMPRFFRRLAEGVFDEEDRFSVQKN